VHVSNTEDIEKTQTHLLETAQEGLSMKKQPASFKSYLLIAFVEGSAVMACELLGAKMIAPFYGSSLLVWSSVIGVTLAALASGYFAGGYFADRFTGNTLLFTVLAVGSSFIALMPLSAKMIMEATLSLGVRTGSLVSTLVFLFPPLVCMGMVSPIIIRLASQDVQHTGRTAGSVYAVSTVGGILATFLAGFYAIPTWGLTLPALVAASALGVFPILYFFSSKRFPVAAGLIVLIAGLFLGLRMEKADPRVLYQSEGLLGQVIVSQFERALDDTVHPLMVLFVNRHPQTTSDPQTGYSSLPYVHGVSTIASIKPSGSKALILGLGGASVADEFLRLGFEVEGCELDERISHVAKTYFFPHHNYPVYVDDARHLIRTTQKRYDVVMLDVFSGEQQPPHVLTLETFQEIKQMIPADGLLIMNLTGFLTGRLGLGARSIIKTLREAGYDLRVLATPGSEENRNLLLVASPSSIDFSGLSVERQNECCREIGGVPIPLPFTDLNRISMTDAIVLQDSRPIIELMSLPVNENWRKQGMKLYAKLFRGSVFF